MTGCAQQALAVWGMEDAQCAFVAGRENRVFRVTGRRGDFALRIRRPGLRSAQELRSELQWMDAMGRAGLSVPRPERSMAGNLLETVEGHHADMLGWLAGRQLGKSREPLALDDPPAAFFALGEAMAGLHDASDRFQPPAGFTRPSWDVEGLLGERPLWGRFWDSPAVDEQTRSLLRDFRMQARTHLAALAPSLDVGLIHADLVRENVLIEGDRVQVIDFDDGGYGFRLFDIATALLKNRAEPGYAALKAALLNGYLSRRPLDMSHLDLFMALRAATYVGWIVPRLLEAGSPRRSAYFTAEARDLCRRYLGQRP